MLKLEMETDGDSFAEDEFPHECARIMRDVARRIQDGQDSGAILDINGNAVGRWTLTTETED
jgi:hypothetical protein